jgi:SAM-dependent methyltransferase
MDQFANIAETYDWTEQSTDDILFFLDFAEKVQGPILEIGAGTGRVSVPLAAHGNNITALDISESMLSRAKAKCDSSNISFVTADFLSFSLDKAFKLIIAPARVFEHAISDKERKAAFLNCYKHLQPSGYLVLYVWGPPSDTNPEPPEKSKLIDPSNNHGQLRFYWREKRTFEKQLRTHHYRVEETDGLKRTWQHEPIELRWYSPENLDNVTELIGFTVRGRYQDFSFTPYKNGSLHMIWVYQKNQLYPTNG